MIIVPISDSHNQRTALPDGDLLIHAGDLTMYGRLKEIKGVVKWFQEISHKYPKGMILVPGNHDFLFEDINDPLLTSVDKKTMRIDVERNPALARKMFEDVGVTVLINQSVEIEGIKIFGSPVQPWFHNWAFNMHRHVIEKVWEKIPDDTQLLVTHGPPFGIGDLCYGGHVGCSALLERIKALKDMKMHIFGHIHEGAGPHWFMNRLFMNASMLDGRYNGFNPIHTVEWETLKIERYPDESI